MNAQAESFWDRANDSVEAAELLLPDHPDAAASRAYYAAFYAVSALFALAGETFRRHTALEAAVHRELVHTGQWDEHLGRAYSELVRFRQRGDYGGPLRVTPAEARESLQLAREILESVAKARPDEFRK